MSEQDSNKKSTSATSAQGSGSGKAGGSGATGTSKGGSGSEETSKAAATSGGSKSRSASRGGRRSAGKQGPGGDPYRSISYTPAPDAFQAHGRVSASDVYQVAPRVWPD
ncbi:hypothetical protein [Thiohalorhabdus methylotrophus]|uniref:Uncharacterized protein n=1 Tax=Thiohalorhabdus methylotrophus TaxID=3242694 RepID=A0ABV4TUA4_9GAMM